MAGLPASEWIVAAALDVWQAEAPDLMLLYVPHLDYDLQRFGPDSAEALDALAAADALVGRLLDGLAGATVLVVGEYGMTPVRGAVHPNRILREAGLLAVYEAAGGEYVDFAASRAFAMADHQVAHCYCTDATAVEIAADALGGVEGVEALRRCAEPSEVGREDRLAGEILLVSDADRWFSYYYWLDDAKAPPFARTVDIHAKCGYDPVELFVDPATKSIPLDAARVRGSHGRVGDDARDWPLCITADASALAGRQRIEATDFAAIVTAALTAR
jgi:hypothetical protein